MTLVFIALGAIIFSWASKKGQFDDLDSPAHRILFDDDISPDQSNIQSNAQSKPNSDSQSERDKDPS